MGHHHFPVVITIISALIASGCQTGRQATIAEYRPTRTVAPSKAPASEVFELVRWQPVRATMTASANPVPQVPIEVQRRYLDRGQPLGFARANGQLLAIAGDTAVPLVEAHYEWKTLPGTSQSEMMNGVLTAVMVVTVVAVIAFGISSDRHWFSHWFGDR